MEPNSVADNEVLTQFIEFYQKLSEKEKFAVGGAFKKATGGDLSPYDSPKPVAVALIPIQDGDKIKLLGIVRGIAPKIGENAFPGGFVNKGEDLLVAVTREGSEETALPTNPEDYNFLTAKTTPGNQMLLFFVNKHVYPKSILDTLKCEPDENGVQEVLEFVLIDENTPMAFPLHKEAAEMFFNMQNTNENKVGTRLRV